MLSNSNKQALEKSIAAANEEISYLRDQVQYYLKKAGEYRSKAVEEEGRRDALVDILHTNG